MSGSAAANITFQTIPSNLRNHGAFVEFVPQANSGQQNYRTLVIGQKTAAGIATPGVPLISAGVQDAIVQGGQGSMLHLMTKRYRDADSFGELWYLPLQDDAASVAAQTGVGVTGTATASGVLSLYVAGVLVPVLVTAGQGAAQVAAAIVAAVAANPDLPVTAALGTGAPAVGFLAKNKGAAGNDIDLRLNYYGAANGEVTPPGIGLSDVLSGTGTQLVQGAQNPTTLAAALANLADKPFDFVVFPYTDPASLNAWQLFMDGNSGRWSWDQMLYGGAFAGYRGNLAQSVTFLTGRNDAAISITPVYDAPEPSWLWAARLCGDCAVSLRANPAVPLQELVTDLLPPPLANRFTPDECNALLFDGGSTFTVNAASQVVTNRMITTYQLNAAGVPDDSWLDVETRYTGAYVARDLRGYLLSKYPRKIFVDDSTRITGAMNNAVVTPSMVRASVINRYRYLEGLGLVQDSDAFAAAVQVQKVGSMCRILWPGDFANQLRQFGIQIDFSKT